MEPNGGGEGSFAQHGSYWLPEIGSSSRWLVLCFAVGWPWLHDSLQVLGWFATLKGLSERLLISLLQHTEDKSFVAAIC